MSQPIQYCLQKTNNHPWKNWIKLYVPEKSAYERIVALLAFKGELDQIQTIEHTEVIQPKLNWWKQEILEFSKGRPNHPVFKALIANTRQPWPIEHFENMVDAAVYLVSVQSDLHMRDLKAYCLYSMGQLLHLIEFAFSNQQPTESLHSLAIKIEIAMQIQFLGPNLKHHRVLLPIDLLNEFKLSIEQLTSFENQPQILAAIKALAKEANSQPQIRRGFSTFLNMLDAYYSDLLQQIMTSHYNPIQETLFLSPLHTHWLFYKVRRQCKKNIRKELYAK